MPLQFKASALETVFRAAGVFESANIIGTAVGPGRADDIVGYGNV